ncbi:molecular chaperone [Affinibrenneria salicis]|uniref:Molecular chaperone n=1 Tax=Affinibrenneria salicis TaxID=2590031 RepID=A0A5J5G3Q2_9GAMM|nr:molecular chaperone [Affinibrenneria salicis]KAA9001370.1 molecular chaperone [Affinibrenneria salicis]
MSRHIILALLWLFSAGVKAVYFDSIIYEMPADRDFISRQLFNDTQKNNIYTISAYRIDRPGAGGERRLPMENGELLYAPLKFSVDANGKEYFKIFYRGPRDDKERYYRIIFKESPLTLFPFKPARQKTYIFPVVSMNTILVVRPRTLHFAYRLDERNGTLQNSGNTFFRVIIQKGCDGDDESSTQFYMLPGEIYKNRHLSDKNKKYLVAMGKYIKLGANCFRETRQ